MALQDKYSKLLQYAKSSGVKDLTVNEQNNVLYVNGKASESVKDRMWAIYDEIDPDMRAGDLVMSIEVDSSIDDNGDIYEVKPGDSLSKIAAKYPGITWNKIYEANKDIIKDPDVIHPGQKLKIPK
ncbi:MAG: LysM peptidoglycan-binding domain-containing protein [Dysgonomonas sp.]|nr:LysM peptidoglycan-binding domain-containing protein [Dysgonomonas sp.]